MANNASRRAREKRLRARYRRKIFFTAVLWLLIGAVAAYVLLSLDIIPEWDELTGTVLPTTETVMATPSPEVTQEPLSLFSDEATGLSMAGMEITETEATPLPTTAPTATPTEAPTVTPTEAPTEESAVISAAIPTEEPTEAPTEVPTAVPTMAPTEEPAATQEAEEQASMMNVIAEMPVEDGEQTDAQASAAPTVAIMTAEPTAEPTPEPTAEPEPIIVPYGEAYTFDAQITSEGKAAMPANGEASETLSLTLSVDAYKDHAYFEANYAEAYILQGNEAAVEFDLTLNGYTGSTDIIPQEALLITFVGKDESEVVGFQLIDREMEGKTGITIASDVTTTLYKRYPYSADQGDMEYMVVTAYNNGEKNVYWFEIHDPNPEPTATPEPTGLTVGSTGDDVKRLQQKLIELGLLQGSPDGKYGSYTAEAVKILQGRYGMEQTGIADEAFLKKVLG